MRLIEEDIDKFLEENEDFMIEIQKTNGKTNMDDYFFKYLQQKKKLTEEKNYDNLKLPFKTAIPVNQFSLNNQPNFQSGNLQNLKFPPTMNSMMQPVNMNLINNPNLKLNFPFNQNLIGKNANVAINNPNLQNINKLLLQQQVHQRMGPQNNMQINNANFNNLINNPNFNNQANLLGLKNLANNFSNLPIQNMINSNQQIPNLKNLQNFQNPVCNINNPGKIISLIFEFN